MVLLAQSPGITPAELPVAGLLTDLQAAHALDDATFTAVGYGETRTDQSGGWHARVPRDGIRRYTSQQAHALRPSWLTLSSNAATGDGGSCYGDSGGPHFLGGTDSNLVVSTTIDVDSTCRALDQTYRLDTPDARAFLSQYVTCPDRDDRQRAIRGVVNRRR